MISGNVRRTAGRRPGPSETRDKILRAALRSFAEKGYNDTTVRGVARAVDVDPSLIVHFFENKDGLLRAALHTPGNPFTRIGEAMDGDVLTLGERLMRHYLGLWEDPETGDRMSAMMRAATASKAASEMVVAFMTQTVIRPMAENLGIGQAELRANLVGTQLMGLGMARYVLRVEPLASVGPGTVISWVAPTLQRYITGDLPGLE